MKRSRFPARKCLKHRTGRPADLGRALGEFRRTCRLIRVAGRLVGRSVGRVCRKDGKDITVRLRILLEMSGRGRD